jgi:hypothetical protein
MKRSVLLLSVVFGLACSSAGRHVTMPADCGALTIAGTFSDLHVREGVGVFGAEVTVVPTDVPYFQAVVQFGMCEFEPESSHGAERCFRVSNLVLVNALTEDETKANKLGSLEFAIDSTEPFAGTFEGVISDDALRGTFSFSSGNKVDVHLPRTKSYWQR